MAEDNDDQWLYGDSDPDKPTEESAKSDLVPDANVSDEKNDDGNQSPPTKSNELSASDNSEPLKENDEESTEIAKETIETGAEENEKNKDKDKGKESDEEEEEDDDHVNVVIGDLRTTPGYGSGGLHIKRGNLLTLTKQPGKFNVEDFDSVGTINGTNAHEFNLDALEEKPWRKPGADISDYFNYGFNEDTWKAYCERQKRMRVHESGTGLIPMNTNNPMVGPPPIIPNLIPQVKSNAQESIIALNNMPQQIMRTMNDIHKENVIQVMTADRREYGRKNFPQDMSVPPPMIPPPSHQFQSVPPVPPPGYMGNTFAGPGDYYPTDVDPYYQPVGYNGMHEPWVQQEWTGVIPLTNSDTNAEPRDSAMNGNHELPGNIKIKQEPDDDYKSDRSKESEQRERERDRYRERSHRHRSRSRSHERRSRKHKSRSRSGHRSHKKKKSKKTDRSKDGSSE